jgi:S-adenosylmethionine decarboxylase proenzyme
MFWEGEINQNKGQAMMLEIGRHVIAELFGCNPNSLKDEELLKDYLRGAVKACGATLVSEFSTRFEPYGGVTAIAVIAESHLSIHTWPEFGYAALDIFTCGKVNPWKAYEYIVKKLRPEKVSVSETKRGMLAQPIKRRNE